MPRGCEVCGRLPTRSMPSSSAAVLALSPALVAATLVLPASLRDSPWSFAATASAAPLPLLRQPFALRRAVCRASFADIEFAFQEEEEAEAEQRAAEDPMLALEASLTDRPATNLTVAELQSQLKQMGQRHTGTKAELIERVQLMQRKKALGLPVHDMQVKRADDMRWYMLQTANGFERSVERTINMAIKAQRLEDKIERVWVPILEGETSVRESSVMPSYIFVRMQMSSSLHFLISEMQFVINFVGADRGGRSMSGQMVGNRGFVRPMPMTDEAFEKILALTRAKLPKSPEEEAEAAAAAAFALDEIVEVTEGPFKGMQGPVIALSDDADELTLALTVMGRDTPVTLQAEHCDRVDDVPT